MDVTTSEGEFSSRKKQLYTPHLKKVLRSFQASAHTSLHGPNSVMGVWHNGGSTVVEKSLVKESTTHSSSLSSNSSAMVNNILPSSHTSTDSPPSLGASGVSSTVSTPATERTSKSSEDDLFTAPPPFPIQQPPIFTPPDQSACEHTQTILENETISCFTVGGEKRLCLPQILNTVLRDFSLQQINCVCDNLHIFCSRCTSEQLEILKNSGVLPLSAPSCGLITKSDAERLCSALLDSNPPRVITNPDAKIPFQVKIYHECFGKCAGFYMPDLYMDPTARCVECLECHGLFSLQKFVCHAHHPKENRTCHWGFDSFNWRCYTLLDRELESDPHIVDIFKEMKNRYDFSNEYNQTQKRKQMLSESKDTNKKIRIENIYPYSCPLDSTLVYWYPNPAWSKVAAFKPMPSVITRNEKSFFTSSDALPHFLKERSPYFLHDPSVFVSDHSLSLHETDRYETHYQANVKFGSISKLALKNSFPSDNLVDVTHQEAQKTSESIPAKHLVFKKEHNYNAVSSCCFDNEDAFSDTSSSTLSAGTDDGLVLTYDDDDVSMSSFENEFLSLISMLKENGVESALSTKILTQAKSITKQCLKNSMKNKQMEFEKVYRKQCNKNRKLKETIKNLEKKLTTSQTSVAEISNQTMTTVESQTSSAQSLPSSPIVKSTLDNKETESPHTEEAKYTEEKKTDNREQDIESHNCLPKSPLVEVKVEPISK